MAEESLRGKVALATGAGSGLGEATARAFAKAGCAVACVDINADAAERVRRELGPDAAESLALRCTQSPMVSYKRLDVEGVGTSIPSRAGRCTIVIYS